MGNILSSTPPTDSTPPPHIPQPDDPFLKKQTVVVEGTGDWGSGAHRSVLCDKGELLGIDDPFVTSLYDIFRQGAAKNGDLPCMGWRPIKEDGAGDYEWITYKETTLWATDIGSAIRHIGLQRGDCVGLYAKNCVEWVVVEQACNAYTHPTVAIYDTFGADAVRFIINHSELTIVFAEKAKLTALYHAISAGTPALKTAVCFGDVSTEDVDKFAASGVTLMTLADLRTVGQAHMQSHDPPTQDDPAIIMYTSGTTGDPKGVVITHMNMVSTCNAVVRVITIVPTDVYFSFLPLAHCFERIVHTILWRCGARLGFFQGDIRKLPDDIKALRPTVFVGVPRVFNRFHEKVLQAIECGGTLTQQLYHRAYAYRRDALARGQDTPWFNYLLFDKLRATLGGRVRMMISGSAPLDARVHEWLRVCMCPVIQQGYGLTETCAGTCVQTVNDHAVGTIGHPLPNNEFKLADVPDMDYHTTDNPPRGELLIRGYGVFPRYFKDPEKTKEELVDGWFHTGDIGMWNEDGTLSIVDRKKNIFKMAQGEYIAVESLEMVYSHSPHAAQIYVYGDSLKTFLLAVVVPDEELAMQWAKANGVEGDFAAVCKSSELRSLLEGELLEQAKIAKLKGFEVVKGVVVHDQLFTVENHLMTPTFKIKRPVAVKVFKAQFDKLYEEIEAKMKR